MIFSSRIFLFIFLPFALAGYFIIPKKLRNFYLVIISWAFYAWADPKFLLILLGFIALDYISGILIIFLRKKHQRLSAIFAQFAVVLNLAILVCFKYLNFFIDNLNNLTQVGIPLSNWLLPLGISFYTFSGISYLLDINQGMIEAEKNPVKFALYIAFFPKLLQGPIARFSNFKTQAENRLLSLEQFANGVYRFVIGLSKKVIIADQLSPMVDHIFRVPAVNHSVPITWLGALGYALQIYFDFSGYTDMAIGLGKMFGFNLPENFDHPYLSLSIAEFWRRWHITLSNWFRVYVFIPLEFKRRKTKFFRQETNLIILFLITGLWHGAAWNFVLWGAWHGFFIVLEKYLYSKNSKIKIPVFFRWMITMIVLMFGWVLFRAPSLDYAMQYIGVMLGAAKTVKLGFDLSWYLNTKTIIILMAGVLACVPWNRIIPTYLTKSKGSKVKILIHDVFFLVLLAVSMAIVITYSTDSFIYFNF